MVFRPKSILRLIQAGFAMVSLPLIVALVNVALSVDEMAEQSRQTVADTVRIARISQGLAQQTEDLERTARQYMVLGKTTLLEVYRKTHNEFHRSLARLKALAGDADLVAMAGRLAQREGQLYQRLEAAGPGSKRPIRAHAFADLSRRVRDIVAASNGVIDREAAALDTNAEQTKTHLAWQVIGVVPVALVLALVFTLFITNPIRQIAGAIRQLGDGDFNQGIQVTGPRDLVFLGAQLDWLRTRLLELEQEKTKFLRHISHELKTPLTVIREGSELLKDELAGPLTPEQREIALMMRDNGVQLQQRIEDLLRFSIATRETLPFPRHPIALEAITARVVANHRLPLRSKNAKLSTRLRPVTVAGDEQALATIVDNLLSNAVKYCPASGLVEVTLDERDGLATLDVRDTGPGFHAADRNKVFEAFFQGRAPVAGHVKGTGLGLSIVKEYVHAHDGNIEVVDDPVGAHLRVTLPAIAPRRTHAR